MTGPQAAAWYLRVQAAVIVDRQSKTLLTDETLQRLRALRQRQWQKAAADFNKRQGSKCASRRINRSMARGSQGARRARHDDRRWDHDRPLRHRRHDRGGRGRERAAGERPGRYVWAEGYGGRPGWVLCVD